MDRGPEDRSARSPAGRANHAATVRLGDGREVTALVTNLSDDGCQLLAEADLSVGETLVVTLPDRDPIEAQVRWTAGDKAGIRFLNEDPPEQRRARIGV